MIYIAPIAVIGILLLQLTGSIPLSRVGGPMTNALAFLVAAQAVGIHEAWAASASSYRLRRSVGVSLSVVYYLEWERLNRWDHC